MDEHRAQAKYSFRGIPEKRDQLPEQTRDAFTVDRDRILQSKAFRRMRGKTQVFVSTLDDHVRTRLTHTLEVSQIARSLGRGTNLNEILLEAAAYGHDLGHTPYGHVGERTLHDIASGQLPLPISNRIVELKLGGFKHNVQSLRQVAKLETHQTAWEQENTDFDCEIGLNLTAQTRWAMVVHTKIGYPSGGKPVDSSEGPTDVDILTATAEKSTSSIDVEFYSEELRTIDRGFSLEALALALADEIAQQHHDLVDGFLIGLISEEDVTRVIAPLLHKLGKVEWDAYEAQLKSAKRAFSRTGEISRMGAVISKHTANSLIALGQGFLASAIERFCAAFQQAGGTLGQYSIPSDSAIWDKTLRGLGGNPHNWQLHPLGMPYGVLSALAQTEEGSNWLNPKLWPDKCGEALCDLTFKRVIRSEEARRMDGKARFLVRRLVAAYFGTPELLRTGTLAAVWRALEDAKLTPAECNPMGHLDSAEAALGLIINVLKTLGKAIEEEERVNAKERTIGKLTIRIDSEDVSLQRLALFARVIIDHVAGMTDNYAAAEHGRLYDSSSAIR